jgi:hypothetical protein
MQGRFNARKHERIQSTSTPMVTVHGLVSESSQQILVPNVQINVKVQA